MLQQTYIEKLFLYVRPMGYKKYLNLISRRAPSASSSSRQAAPVPCRHEPIRAPSAASPGSEEGDIRSVPIGSVEAARLVQGE